MRRDTSLMAENARIPAPPKILPRGNHRYSTFEASLCNLNAGNCEESLFASQLIEILLFTSDCPGAAWAYSFYTQSTTPAFTATNWFESGPYVNANVPNILDNAVPAAQSPMEMVRGDTETAGVAVTGYSGGIVLIERTIELNGSPVLPSVVVWVVANSGVPDGPLHWYRSNLATTLIRDAVLLYEPDYTQAMKDAGDVYTDGNGNVYEICGLFYAASINPL